MTESQKDRVEELSVGAAFGSSSRELWSEDRRLAFLNVADRVGWSDHSAIARHLDLTVHQIRNFKQKFSRSRWREKGSEVSASISSTVSENVEPRQSSDAEHPDDRSGTGFSSDSSRSQRGRGYGIDVTAGAASAASASAPADSASAVSIDVTMTASIRRQSDIGTLNVASGMTGDSDAGFSGESPQS